MKKKVISAIVLLFCVGGSLFSLVWPVDTPELLVNFGSFFADRLWTGVLLATESTDVKAIDNGEMLFYYQDEFCDIPSKMGNFMVLQHESGLRSLYGHISDPRFDDYVYDEGQQIASTAVDELSGKSTLYVGIYDVLNSSRVNPQILLPLIEDKAAPVLDGIRFVSPTMSRRMTTYTVMKPGVYDVYIKASDAGDGHINPYKIEIIRNERTLFDVSFDAMDVAETTKAAESQRFTDDGYMLLGPMEIEVGRYKYTIKLRDANLNEYSVVSYLIIEQ